MHILVVDPNVAFGTLLSEELVRLGYSVDQASEGTEAMAFARQTAPALAVLDMALEAPDALTLASELVDLDENVRLMLIPLIGENLDVNEHALPIKGVLPKPFFLPELPSMISAALGMESAENAGTYDDDAAESSGTPVDDQGPGLNRISAHAPPTSGEAAQKRGGSTFSSTRFQDNEDRVRKMMENLIFEVGAESALLTLDEKLLAYVGVFDEVQAESIANVVLDGWRSSEKVARILGKEQLRFEQSIAGGSYMLYALGVDVNAILAVAIRGSSTLGMIRHRAREVAEHISRLCSGW